MQREAAALAEADHRDFARRKARAMLHDQRAYLATRRCDAGDIFRSTRMQRYSIEPHRYLLAARERVRNAGCGGEADSGAQRGKTRLK